MQTLDNLYLIRTKINFSRPTNKNVSKNNEFFTLSFKKISRENQRNTISKYNFQLILNCKKFMF